MRSHREAFDHFTALSDRGDPASLWAVAQIDPRAYAREVTRETMSNQAAVRHQTNDTVRSGGQLGTTTVLSANEIAVDRSAPINDQPSALPASPIIRPGSIDAVVTSSSSRTDHVSGFTSKTSATASDGDTEMVDAVASSQTITLAPFIDTGSRESEPAGELAVSTQDSAQPPVTEPIIKPANAEEIAHEDHEMTETTFQQEESSESEDEWDIGMASFNGADSWRWKGMEDKDLPLLHPARLRWLAKKRKEEEKARSKDV